MFCVVGPLDFSEPTTSPEPLPANISTSLMTSTTKKNCVMSSVYKITGVTFDTYVDGVSADTNIMPSDMYSQL